MNLFRPASPAEVAPTRSRRGFTLIELLVVVSLIVMLVALLMPALSEARKTARTTACASNMRQLVSATTDYVLEYGAYPQPTNDSDIENAFSTTVMAESLWFNALDRFLGAPSINYTGDPNDRNYLPIKQDPIWSSDIPDSQQRDQRTIKMNANFGDLAGSSWKFYSRSVIREPSRTVMFVDGRAYDVRPVDTLTAGLFYATEGRVGLRHNSGANVGFPDGHVAFTWQDVRTDTAAPSWYSEPSPLQTLVWKLTP